MRELIKYHLCSRGIYEIAMTRFGAVTVLVYLYTVVLAEKSCRDSCNYGDTLGGVDLTHLKG